MSDFPDIDILNRRFGAPDRIVFRQGPSGLPVAALANSYGAAEISLYGAHVLSYRPLGLGPVIFLSSRSPFEPGQSIRGGIPVCWPWFGKNGELPLHGLARINQWELSGTSYTGTETELTLRLRDTDLIRRLWPHPFELSLTFTLGQTLKLALTTRNTGAEPFSFTQAFHPYFQISNSRSIQLLGFDNARFEERILAGNGVQHGPLLLDENETNKLFTMPKNDAAIYDEALRRIIALTFSGTRDLVVWNPGRERCAAFTDFEPLAYTRFVCVEPANTVDTALDLEPGHKHTLTLTIQARHL